MSRGRGKAEREGVSVQWGPKFRGGQRRSWWGGGCTVRSNASWVMVNWKHCLPGISLHIYYVGHHVMPGLERLYDFESNTKKYSTSIVMLHCTTEQYWANTLFGITQHGYMSGCYPITNENRDAALLGTLCCSYSLVITVRLRKKNSSYEYWTDEMSGDIWQCMESSCYCTKYEKRWNRFPFFQFLTLFVETKSFKSR